MSWRPSTLTRAQLEERRREGGRLLRAGRLSHAQIARRLEVSHTAVSVWNKALEEQGLRGLRARRTPGRPAALTPEQNKQLRAILRRGARAAGYPTERWTQARVREVIAHEFRVTYHVNAISRVLKRLGWSVQQPEARALERDETLIRAWLTHDWPRIKKGAAIRRGNRVRG